MNINAVKTLIFFGGALVGSAVTYILCAKKEKDHVEAVIKDYEEEFRKMSESITADDIPDETVRADEDPMKFKYDKKTDYTQFANNAEAPVVPTVSHPDYEAQIQSNSYAGDSRSSRPESITSNAFYENKWHYVQETLLWYADDECLVYEDGHSYNDEGRGEEGDYIDYEPIDIKDQLVGDNNLDLFELCDCTTIFVVNHAEQRLYEIELVHGPCPIHDWD